MRAPRPAPRVVHTPEFGARCIEREVGRLCRKSRVCYNVRMTSVLDMHCRRRGDTATMHELVGPVLLRSIRVVRPVLLQSSRAG